MCAIISYCSISPLVCWGKNYIVSVYFSYWLFWLLAAGLCFAGFFFLLLLLPSFFPTTHPHPQQLKPPTPARTRWDPVPMRPSNLLSSGFFFRLFSRQTFQHSFDLIGLRIQHCIWSRGGGSPPFVAWSLSLTVSIGPPSQKNDRKNDSFTTKVPCGCHSVQHTVLSAHHYCPSLWVLTDWSCNHISILHTCICFSRFRTIFHIASLFLPQKPRAS